MLPVVPPGTGGLVPKHYVIVRPDLPLGLLAAQVTHAAGESAALRAPPPECHAVVLAAGEDKLRVLAMLLRARGFPIATIFEDDEPYKGALMAIGVAPCTPGVQRWLRHLPLLGKQAVPSP